IDTLCGFGSFTLSDVPHTFPDQHQFFWPYITNDANDRIHVICTENEPAAGDPQVVGHTYSTDGGETWSDLAVYDEIMDISAIITASRVDDKVAIVYTKPIDDGDEPNQYNNDAVYIESEDGITWDYEDIINITNYQWEDTIRAYTDIDAVYDFNGSLHVVWNTSGYFADDGTITVDACFLWHWSEATGISMMFDAWHPSFPGSWNRSACKMSIAVDEDNNLFTQWSHFDSVDVSAGGYSNAEIYISTSIDGGENWIDPINLSNTPCPGCSTGECFSEHWPSMAEFADDSIYIMYIEDKDPGRISGYEGAETVNPVRYFAVPTESLLPTSVEDDNSIPDDFELSQNYPNPFNSSTTISYTLSSPADVKLEIYNLIGQKVEALVNDKVKAGKHSIKLDASKYASGVYFYKLETDGYTTSKKMHLLK
ncbi:MAG: T9SS type A sorting domain-containing protein, partial [candidate division Zixibacteria bacterium]|nr:T9SS type A sorting domain-containing protein [candidate division Zixibacteria bacterium]